MHNIHFVILVRLIFHVLDCNEVYNLSVGYIKSPYFPSNYPNGVSCYYLIINSDPETRILLSFLRFDLESDSHCSFDSVKIYDGNSSSATQIGQTYGYCGKRAPPTLTVSSTGNSILVVFTSNHRGTSLGFSASYTGRIPLTYLISPATYF